MAVSAFIVIFLYLCCVTSQPSGDFRSRPLDVTTMTGSSVRFRCKVSKLAINQAVAWMKSDRAGLTSEWLSSGTDILVSEPLASRIKIVGTTRSNLRYDLYIGDLESSDDGLYICTILTFGNVGIMAQERSRGNTLRVLPSHVTPGPDSQIHMATTESSADPLLCDGFENTDSLVIGEMLTLMCTKRIHRFDSREDIIYLRWSKNNRIVASKSFEPDIPAYGKIISLVGENLTLTYSFRVQTYDQGAIFSCDIQDSNQHPSSSGVCTLAPLQVTSNSDFILSGHSVIYVEEGEGARLFCPQSSRTNSHARHKTLIWMMNPLLQRERYTVSAIEDAMHLFRLELSDDGLQVSCMLNSNRRTETLGEATIRVTKDGQTLSSKPTEKSSSTSEIDFTTAFEGNYDLTFETESASGLFDGSGIDEIRTTTQNYIIHTTLPMDSASTTSSPQNVKRTPTVRQTPLFLTTGKTSPPSQERHKSTDSNIVNPFVNFDFPSDQLDWFDGSDPDVANDVTSPPTLTTKNESVNFFTFLGNFDSGFVILVIFVTPLVALIFVICCVFIVVCGPKSSLSRSSSAKNEKTTEAEDPAESVWPTGTMRRYLQSSGNDKTSSQPTDDNTHPSVVSTHIYASTDLITSTITRSHFESHTQFETFGLYSAPYPFNNVSDYL
ncbi:hypothetical protein HOLleu_32736 [Holothuria leucospilota]|uniref:Ig-like domain-containing protein n=1 Tax=Holothuria leucospilota TaxID=206669 RepID=A0A9Q1BJ48_HOLLE|nr:hypothetical protein HOLleu_32736 [Holothuria leucospilota]